MVAIRFGRLLRNARVTLESIVAGWSEDTAPAAKGRHVLAIQDTTDINLTTTEGQDRGLGVLGTGERRGHLLHPMIAVDAETQECLGLVCGTLWTRPETEIIKTKKGKKRKNPRRPFEEKESRHWVETAQKAKAILSDAAVVTMIADREADIYQMWALVPDEKVHVLGRAYHDRRLADGGTLTTAAAHWPVLGTRCITIRGHENGPEREANLAVTAGTITFPRPREKRYADLPEQVTLTLIELTEPHPPEGVDPVTWRLLTTHVVPDAAAAWQIVDWYRSRWIIEQFFRTLKKQGFHIEDSQVETAERLLKLVAIAARAAVITIQLTQARDGISTLSAAMVFSPAEIMTLQSLDKSYAKPTQARNNPHPPHSLSWASWLIARLGGWSGYGGKTRPPGPITFKNGLDVLRNMARGWVLRDMYIP